MKTKSNRMTAELGVLLKTIKFTKGLIQNQSLWEKQSSYLYQ